MNEGEDKAEVGVENLKPVVEVGSEQNVGEAVKDANDFMNSEINKLKEETSAKLAGLDNKKEGKSLKEKREALKGLKIDDGDIVEKLAAALGTDKDAFDAGEVEKMKAYYAERKGHWEDNMGWQEWKIQKTGDTVFANNDGTFGIKG